jgi:hypothetical protein
MNAVWWEIGWEREKARTVFGGATEITKRLSSDVRILNALDITASHGMFHIVYKLFPISPQLLGCV